MRRTIEETQTTRVTRDVDVAAVRDLLDHPPRATVAFADGGAVDVRPAYVQAAPDHYRFAVAAAPNLAQREVVLLLDDGAYWFELRGISVRGIAEHVKPPAGSTDTLAWYRIAARRVLAWDYGAIREE